MNDPQKKYRLGTVSKNILLESLNQFHGANLTLSSDVDQAYDVVASITVHLQILKRPQLPRFSTDLDETCIKIHGLSFI